MSVTAESIKVENVVASSDIGQELDLDTLSGDLQAADYNPDNFPGLVYRMTDPKAAALIFRSGKVVCTGAQSVDDVEERGHDFELTATMADVDPADYDALCIPGGRAPEYLRSHDEVIDVVTHFFDEDKPVATLCHGPQILAAADVLDGYEMTSYPAVKPEVEAAGCSWVDGVVTDRNLVTAQAWPDHPEWIAQFLDLLGDEIRHDEPVAADDD